ncbi:MAG: hypothetical protein ACT4P8_01910 [Betaproteobacteria bacterium]
MIAEVERAGRKQTVFPYAAGICTALFAFAFVAAPHSCEWGLNAYFTLGLVAVFALFFGPLWLLNRNALSRRLLLGLGLAVTGLVVWTAGLFAANVQILCRLF